MYDNIMHRDQNTTNTIVAAILRLPSVQKPSVATATTHS